MGAPDTLADLHTLTHVVTSAIAALRWNDADVALRAFLDGHPDSAGAHALAGELCREEWRLDEAAAAFGRALDFDTSHADARAGLGFVQIVTGRLEQGIANCRWAIQQRSDLAAPRRHLASALILQGDAAAAAEQALEARRFAPLQPENTIVLAAAWFRCGLRSGAERLIERVIREDPRRAEAWITRAAFRYAAGDDSGAVADVQRGLALKPWLPPAHALKARLHAGAGQARDALDAIARARARNPASEEYLLLEAALLAATGRRAVALQRCRADWWRHPKSRELKARIAMWSLEQGHTEEARRCISGLLPAESIARMWRRLGDVWLELGSEFGADAHGCYRHALAEGDEAPSLRLAVAQLSARLQRPDVALADLDGLDSPQAAALAAELLERLDRRDEALDRLERAAGDHPADGFAAMRLGMALRARGRLDDAGTWLDRAAELAPEEPAVHEQLAILQSDRGRFDDALKAFRRAAELSPEALSIRFNIAVVLSRQQRWREAEQAFRQVVASNPLHVDALAKLAHVLGQQKRWAESIELLELASERAPHDPSIRETLVFAHRALHRIDEAVAAAQRWVDDAPEAFGALALLARQLAARKDPDADATADRAWALSPDSCHAMEMRADVAVQLGRYAEAVEWLDRALVLEPDNISLLTYRGFAVQELAGPAAGETMLRRVLALAPDTAHAPMNLALLGLRLGNFREGWRLYETRDSAIRSPRSLIAVRDRAGTRPDLSQSSVYVRAEQGLGDTLQFMRYVSRLARDAGEVYFQMPEAITWTARDLGPNVRVYGYGDRVPGAEYETALLSLPLYYETDVDSIPADVPYVTPDAGRVAAWRARIGDRGFRIGLAWQTDPGHGNVRRWIPLAHLGPLAEIPGVRLISLQKQYGTDQIRALPASQSIEELGDRFDDGPEAFADTAAVIETLDLVIAIDTAVAHLAGALARPVWILLHRTSDWRWLVDREHSPWYPTARLVRQRVSDDWTDVAARVSSRVRAVISGDPVLWPV
jgi:tetratricopeptide (TPR) repeat protein